MASHEAYLRTSLSKYQNADRTKLDILNVIAPYKDLRPVLDNFVFNDGSKKELMCLSGTIPVNFKGSVYNIPICLWLMDTHPYNPPMAFVRPTSTMMIKPGRHVDSNGRIYLPYLHEWKFPQSDLLGLIQVLIIVFGQEPPVFAKSAAPPRPSYPPQARPPAPAANTPYPQAGSGMPVPSFPGAASSVAPGYPPAAGGYPPQQSYPGYPGYNQPPAAAATGMYPPQSQPGYPAHPTYNQPAQAGYTPPTNTSASTQSSAVSDQQIRDSLLTAVEEKVKRRLQEIFAQGQAEMDVLKKTQEDLQNGKQRLDTMLDKLEREQNEVERNLDILKEKEAEVKQVLAKMEGREEVSIDDVVVPSAPLYKQLLNAFAEEQATDDAIYYLGEGLRKGATDLDIFLKQVRELSRRQFLQRALVHKCRQKAGLPDLSG